MKKEQTSKSAVALHRKALKAAEKKGPVEHVTHQLRCMNPRKMSPADIDICNNVLERKP